MELFDALKNIINRPYDDKRNDEKVVLIEIAPDEWEAICKYVRINAPAKAAKKFAAACKRFDLRTK